MLLIFNKLNFLSQQSFNNLTKILLLPKNYSFNITLIRT